MSSLSRRLAQLRKSGGSLKTSPGPVPASGESRTPPGAGWKKLDEGAWERTIDYPGLLPEIFEEPFVLPRGVSPEDLVFYDLETTGLSGGSGNTAFLIGLGRQSSGSFTVTQLFLADYPGEPVLLERYAELIQTNPPQVSYNGRSFDSQVLKTRFLINRMPALMPPQIDLLYPSRRLWKGVLPNLSLGTLEKEVLGFYRENDLPGREAPDAWFEWLKGDERRIEGVFTHNAEDIVSLARLLVHLEKWGGTDPGDSQLTGLRSRGAVPSYRGMARQWSLSSPGIERRWLKAGWEAGESICGRELALRFRREGDFPSAAEIWKKLNASGKDFSSAVELAKYYEHRLKTPEKALDVLEGLDNLPLNHSHRRELVHRRQRLERKLRERGMGRVSVSG